MNIALDTRDENLIHLPNGMPIMMICASIGSLDIIEANGRFKTEFGFSDKDLANKSIYDILPTDQFIVAADLFESIAQQHDICRYSKLEFISNKGLSETFTYVSLKKAKAKKEPDIFVIAVFDVSQYKEKISTLKIYKRIMAHISDLVSFVDTDYRYKFVNNTYLNHFGLLEEEIVGRTVDDLHKERAAPIKNMLDRTFAGETVHFETEIENPRLNAVTQVDSIFSPYYEADGRISGVIVTARDITEAKTTKQSLNQERLRYKALFNSSPDLLATIDLASGSILQSNYTLQAILGYTEDELKAKTVFDLYAPDNGHSAAQLIARLRLGDKDGELASDIVAKNKTSIVTNLRVSLLENNDESTDKAIFVWRDMRHQNHLAYLASHDQLTSLLNRGGLGEQFLHIPKQNQPTYICFLDLDNFKSVNDTLGHAMGDRLLVNVARAIKSVIRKTDIAARIGGDEFVVILPGCARDHVVQIMINLRQEIEKLGSRTLKSTNKKDQISITIGIAEFSSDISLSDTIELADAACYKGKKKGKNAIYMADKHEDTAISI